MNIIEIEKKHGKYINEILYLEKESFGELGAVDIWLLKPFIKYGKVLALQDENNKIIGVAEFIRGFDGNIAYIYGICIHKKERGKGRGKIFLQEIKEYMNKKNIEKLELTVSPNNTGALNLYKGAGFEIIEELKDEYGQGEDRVLMRCNLK